MAAVFGVSLKAVDIWWAKWQAGGREALVMRPRGKPVGVHQVLGESEQAAVRQAVLDHRPCDVGLSGQLWTRRLIGDLIAKLYRVRLTEVGVGKYLKRWGLSFQRPDKRAVEQDPLAVRRWHRETWPKIRAKAKQDGGEILFADQVGIRSDQVTGRTWGEPRQWPTAAGAAPAWRDPLATVSHAQPSSCPLLDSAWRC
ncbi:winged helix-turn-helix domain-containing protein [Streptomyces sp. L2]|uniref:winged helix-turn-helix domain-containing protein n=1 Tax=Streptomyces sp. L2 TaxID=2162665 RepID=UPI001F50CDD1|nr:winged helix-turn-helix domain-containing protein [Streptomyces sp. L2]